MPCIFSNSHRSIGCGYSRCAALSLGRQLDGQLDGHLLEGLLMAGAFMRAQVRLRRACLSSRGLI